MKESDLVRKIMKAVKASYPHAYCVKLADRYRRGLPDLMILLPYQNGPHCLHCDQFFVEAKSPIGRLSKIQIEEHRLICKAGSEVLVARDVATVLERCALFTGGPDAA